MEEVVEIVGEEVEAGIIEVIKEDAEVIAVAVVSVGVVEEGEGPVTEGSEAVELLGLEG